MIKNKRKSISGNLNRIKNVEKNQNISVSSIKMKSLMKDIVQL